MSKYDWGTLYLVRPDWDGPRVRMDEAVVEQFENTRSALNVAGELWRLVGNAPRAAGIEQILERGYQRERRFIDAEEIAELLKLTEGLDDEVTATLQMDDEGRVAPERLPELRRTTKTLWLSEERGDGAAYGVWEGLGQVATLRDVLKRSRELGLNIAFD